MTLTAAFEKGVEASKTGNCFDLEFHWFLNEEDADQYDAIWFELGFKGEAKPIKVKGWRYGEFTDNGCSKNYQSGKMERGLSMMEVLDFDDNSIEKASVASAMFGSDRRKVCWATGYYTPAFWGSDGEPLIILGKHL